MTSILLWLTTLLTIGATAIMSYIALATAIGPWIETTIVLCSMLLCSLLMRWTLLNFKKSVSVTTAAAGIGGILATSAAFSLPTLYFLDKALFISLLAHPLWFCSIIAVFCCAAGSFGFLIAHYTAPALLARSDMKFPIGELLYNTIVEPAQLTRAYELIAGFFSTQVFLSIAHMLRIQSTITLTNAYHFSAFIIPPLAIPLMQAPLYLAVGFIAGHVLAGPLLAGFLVKTTLLTPLYYVYSALQPYIPYVHASGEQDFFLALCSGFALCGLAGGIKSLSSLFHTAKKSVVSTNILSLFSSSMMHPISMCCLILFFNGAVLWFFNFSWLAQWYVFVCTGICVYQMLLIAGAIGIVPLGRFATFVMIPGMLLFGFDAIQTTLTAAFVEIAGGVAADVLFGRKLAQLAKVDQATMAWYQLLGLCISACVIGIIFWLFITTFGLGPTEGLCAIKAYNRALLINIQHFDYGILALGCLTGMLLQYYGINPAMLLGGILMPHTISLMLVAGGMLATMFHNRERWYPILSGICAGNSLWLLFNALWS